VSRITPPSDDLAEVLKTINVRSTILCLSHFTAPWGFRVDDSDLAKFHVVLDGTAWLDLDSSAESHRLEAGAIVVLPRGTGHMVRDHQRTPVRHLEAILTDHPLDSMGRLTYGGDGASTTVLCGAFEAALLPDDMTDVLPQALVLDQEGSNRVTRWLYAFADLLAPDSTTRAAPRSWRRLPTCSSPSSSGSTWDSRRLRWSIFRPTRARARRSLLPCDSCDAILGRDGRSRASPDRSGCRVRRSPRSSAIPSVSHL